MLPAEAPGLDLPQLRMVAAPSFGDIVEERRDVEEPMAIETRDQPAAQRILVRELEHREAAQVAHHGEDMLIHRVDVEKVVLHLPDDAPERREIAAQDSVLVHAPQLDRKS